MMRSVLACLALLAAGSAAFAQNPRPAAPAGPAPASPAPAGASAASPAQATPMPPGVQAPGETSVPAAQVIGWIRSGQSRNGELTQADYRMGDGTLADVWYLDATAGQRAAIELHASDFDGYLQLLDPYGAKLAETPVGGDGRTVHITFQFTAAGRYQIVVNSAGHDVHLGPYSLSLK